MSFELAYPRLKDNIRFLNTNYGIGLKDVCDRTFRLNSFALEICQLCDGSRDVADISNYLSQNSNFDIDLLFRRVSEFIKKLQSLGITELRQNPSSYPGRKFDPIGFLQAVSIEITNSCDQNCLFCYKNDLDNSDILNVEEISKLLDQLTVLGASAFCISGGEPFLHADLFEIISTAKTLQAEVSIATNGTSIDNKMAKTLASLGLDSIQISIDGMKPTHNYLRQDSQAFDSALNAMHEMKKVGITTIAVTNVSSLNCKDIIPLNHLLTEYDIDFHMINRHVPSREEQKIIISPKEYKKLLYDLRSVKKCPIISCDPLLNNVVNGLDVICGAGLFGCSITPNAKIKPCDAFQYEIGDLRKEAFEDIWLNSDFLRQIRNLHNSTGGCITCSGQSCMGCKAFSFNLMDKRFSKDKLCFKY